MSDPLDQIEKAAKPAAELVPRLCRTIDGYCAEKGGVSANAVLACLEFIRHKITESILDHPQEKDAA